MEDARKPPGAERAAPGSSRRTAEKGLRFNFSILLAHGALGQTGFRLINAPTFFPAYLSLLADSNAAIGIARAIQSFGMSLSPIVGARMVERRAHVHSLGVT